MGFPSGGDEGGNLDGSLGKIQGAAESLVTRLFAEQGEQGKADEKGSSDKKKEKLIMGGEE